VNTIELLNDFEVYIEKYFCTEDVVYIERPKASKQIFHLRDVPWKVIYLVEWYIDFLWEIIYLINYSSLYVFINVDHVTRMKQRDWLEL